MPHQMLSPMMMKATSPIGSPISSPVFTGMGFLILTFGRSAGLMVKVVFGPEVRFVGLPKGVE